jgi:hypothetical protein
MAARAPILVIDRGDLPSLAATSLFNDPEQLILWHVRETDAAAEARRRIVQTKARVLGVRRLLMAEPLTVGLPELAAPVELYQAAMLLQAAAIARQLECARIVWPRQIGPDFERMAEIVDRASLVSELAGIGRTAARGAPGDPADAIDLPLVDLTDEHLVDLIDEAGAPFELFWPCERTVEAPCGECGGCQRWSGAFEAMGLPWPWAAVSA